MKDEVKKPDPFEEAAAESAGEEPQPLRAKLPQPSDSVEDLDTPLSCGFTRREILQMQQAGLERPSIISHADWYGPKKLNHRHLLVCHLAALGYKTKEIAAATRFSENTIKNILGSEGGKQQVKIIREVEMRGTSVQQSMDQLGMPAVRLYNRILTDDNVKMTIRQKTAQDVLDRKMGKPQQTIEHKGSLIKDFYTMLKQQEQSKAITADFRQLPADASEISEGEIITDGADAPLEVKPVEKEVEASVVDTDKWFKENKI